MANDWTSRNSAQAMLEIFPAMGRLMATRLREMDSDADEATMMQMRVLAYLKEEPITASELAKRRKVSLQSVSVLIQTMVEKGWITRSVDPKDRRQSLLQVTPEGKARAQASLEQITSILTELFSDLSPEELAAASVFLPALHRIVIAHMALDVTPEK
jgi:DNA-binding MarR family transcriptional regulator